MPFIYTVEAGGSSMKVSSLDAEVPLDEIPHVVLFEK